jgi:hypothetical protein
MSEILYGRRYRVIAGSVDVSQLRCTFRIEKNMAETPNFSEIAIFNLSPATENQIIESGERIVLEAGYEGSQYGLIFDGDIVQPLRDKEGGTTYKLTLISQDGDKFLNNGFVNASYRAGQTPRTIAEQLCSTVTNPVELAFISDNLENKKLTRGKVVFGLARDYLHQLARTEQAAFYCNDGKINIIKASDLPAGQIASLSPKTGLIGAAEMTDEGIKATCLLNPLLNLNSFVHIDNSHVRVQKASRDSQPKAMDQDGVYRIVKLIHEGDTRGNTWFTEFTAITQSGNQPNTGNSLFQ